MGVAQSVTRSAPSGVHRQAQPYQDVKTDVKVVLAGLWIAMLFLFAYVDIFGFFRADIINGALDGELPGQDLSINQTFLALSTVFILIPSLMIVVSLLAKPALNRKLNIVVSILYAIVIAGLCIGESWIYYLIGSLFEVILLLAIARVAWRWPSAADRDVRSAA